MLALSILSESGPDISLSWLLLWMLGFFFLVIVVGWLVSQNKAGKSEVQRKDVGGSAKAEAKSLRLKIKRRK